MIEPARFQLTEPQMAAALALGGIRPGRRSTLPQPRATADFGALLRPTGLLATGSPQLAPNAIAVLSAAADPVLMLSIVANRAGSPTWGEVIFYRAAGDGAFAALSLSNGQYDIAVLPTATEALILIDQLLTFTEFASRNGDQAYPLDLAAYTALLASADALALARLQARLMREQRPLPVLDPEQIEALFQRGSTAIDSRWAVTAARMVAPAPLGFAPRGCAAALASLQVAGLLESAQGGWAFREPGYLAAASLGDLVMVGRWKLLTADTPNSTSVAQVDVLRSATGIWLASWDVIDSANSRLTFSQLSSSATMALVLNLLSSTETITSRPTAAIPQPQSQPAAANSRCPACGSDTEFAALFCPKCGTRLSPPSAAPTPPAYAPPTPVYAPPPPQPVARVCPTCSKPVPPGKKFCTNCGTRMA